MQTTSSNPLKAKRNCKRMTVRMGQIIVEVGNNGQPTGMLMPTSLNLPEGQLMKIGDLADPFPGSSDLTLTEKC